MELFKCVVDSDCLLFLFSHLDIFKPVLSNLDISIPPQILFEVKSLEKKFLGYKITLIELDELDKKFCSKMIKQVSQRKELARFYEEGRMLNKIRNLGECEGAALAKKLKIDIVMKDTHAIPVIKEFLKFNQISVIPIETLARTMFKAPDHEIYIQKYEGFVRAKLHK